MIFENRQTAGQMLAQKILKTQHYPDIVLAIPRGGVPVAYEVAKLLQKPLDIIVIRKVGHPHQPELAVCAVTEHQFLVCNDRLILTLDPAWLEQAAEKEYIEAQRRRQKYADRPMVSITHKSVIIVDDGIATGLTMLAALKELHQTRPHQLIVAAPVMSRESFQLLSQESDNIVTLLIPDHFGSVGHYYHHFPQTTDSEVIEYLHLLVAHHNSN